MVSETQKSYDFAVRDATHRVMVRSTHTREGDSKTFRIHAPEVPNEKICELIKHFVNHRQADGKLKDYIRFTHERKRKTHLVMVMPEQSRFARKEATKSFRIYSPSYSSEEIASAIKEFLCGGKNP